MLEENEVTHLIVDMDQVTNAREASAWFNKWSKRLREHLQDDQREHNTQVLKDEIDSLADELNTADRDNSAYRAAIDTAIKMLDDIDVPAARDGIDKAIGHLENAL